MQIVAACSQFKFAFWNFMEFFFFQTFLIRGWQKPWLVELTDAELTDAE